MMRLDRSNRRPYQRMIAAALRTGAAAPLSVRIPSKWLIKGLVQGMERSRLVAVQTPQALRGVFVGS